MEKDKASSEIYNFLNKIFDGKIDDYNIIIDGSGEKGGNFLGDILFVTLKNKTTEKDVHLVIKQAFPNLSENPIFKGVYENEIRFYKDIWQVLDNFQKAHNIGFNKLARFLGSDDTVGSEKIALDNLKYNGYVLHDKTITLTEKHIELIMKSYGIFHGISFAYRELHPEEYEKLMEKTKNISFRPMHPYFAHELKNLVELLENEVNDDILEVLKTYVTVGGQKFVDSLNYEGDTPLLVHGDCWSNNMMFKFDDEGNIEDMKFLDFQYVTSGSPVHDLSYSIYSGVSKDILDNLDFYLKMYHDSFSATMKKLGRDAQKSYPFEKLKEDWKPYSQFGFLMSLPIWRMKYIDRNNIPNIKESNPNLESDSSDSNRRIGISKIADDKVDLHKKRVKDLIIHMYENGFL